LIKLLLKLALAALIANAAFRVGMAYLSFYRFTDAVQQTTQFSGGKSDEELSARVVELASEYDMPLAVNGFTITHSEDHTIVDGAFIRPVEVLPGYKYPWPFSWHTDTFTTRGASGSHK
jgi:hypothetical protein